MSSSRIILAIILAAAVIFCTGVITGSLLIWQAPVTSPGNPDRPAVEPAAARPPGDKRGPDSKPEVPLPRLAERLSKEFVRRLDTTLHLTLTQSNNIARIVAEGQERNRVIWTNVAPHMRKVMQDVNQQIRAELTPEQLKQFEVLMKQPPRRPPPTNVPPDSVVATNVPAAAPVPPPGR
jgi:hypothetical protein